MYGDGVKAPEFFSLAGPFVAAPPLPLNLRLNSSPDRGGLQETSILNGECWRADWFRITLPSSQNAPRWQSNGAHQENLESDFIQLCYVYLQYMRFSGATVRSMRFQAIQRDSTRTIFHKCASVRMLGLWKLTDALP